MPNKRKSTTYQMYLEGDKPIRLAIPEMTADEALLLSNQRNRAFIVGNVHWSEFDGGVVTLLPKCSHVTIYDPKDVLPGEQE